MEETLVLLHTSIIIIIHSSYAFTHQSGSGYGLVGGDREHLGARVENEAAARGRQVHQGLQRGRPVLRQTRAVVHVHDAAPSPVDTHHRHNTVTTPSRHRKHRFSAESYHIL